MLSRINHAKDFLNASVDGASLAVFRIFFGLLMAWESFFHYYADIERWYAPGTLHFTYNFFSWVEPWPGIGMHVQIIAMGIASILIALGLFFRFSAIVFTVLYAHLFLVEATRYNNHYYLIILLGLLLSVSNAHSEFSLDRLRKRDTLDGTLPFWNVLLFRAQMVIMYFYGGIAKLNWDWLRGEPMRHWIPDLADYPLIDRFFTLDMAAYFFSYGGLVFDLTIGFLLLSRRTRLLVLPFLIFFHITNMIYFTIGIFPILALGATILFFPADSPRRWLKWIGVSLERGETKKKALSDSRRNLVLAFVTIYLAIQLLVPFRHWLYPGNEFWTDEGHSFSWHMMLKDKEVKAVFYVRDGEGNPVVRVPRSAQVRDMNRHMREKFLEHPILIVQYAHFLRDENAAKGVENPKVFAEITMSLNGRPFQTLIDPTVDLAATDYPKFLTVDWIVPLPEDLPIGVYPR